MIKLELEVTPEQMRDIADVMAGTYHRPTTIRTDDDVTVSGNVKVTAEQIAAATPELQDSAADIEQITQAEADAGNLDNSAADDVPADATGQDTTATDNGVTLDADGLPWDQRIHASTKAQNADGRWKLRRKPKDMAEPAWLQMIEEVKAELKVTMSASPGDVPPPPAATEAAADVPPPPPATVDAGAALAAAGDNTPPPPPAESASPKTFPELLPLVSAGKANGTISDEQIAVAVTQVGLTKFGELAVRPDLIPQFAELVGV